MAIHIVTAMMIFLVMMGVLAAVGIGWTVRDLMRDGYRRVPLGKGVDEWRGW